MSLCRICFEGIEDGLPIPTGQPDEKGNRALVHEECLARRVADFISQDLQREGLLHYLIQFEENHAPEDWAKEVSAGTADASWTWDKVGIAAPRITPLVNAGLVGIVFASRSSTHYALVGRAVVKRVLNELRQVRERADLVPTQDCEMEIPEDLFSPISGYPEIKAFLLRVLKATRFHVLLVGAPASAKTVFLFELARLPGSFYCLGSATSRAGLAEILCEQRPRILMVDELDKFAAKDLAILLSLAETGLVRETKVSKPEGSQARYQYLCRG